MTQTETIISQKLALHGGPKAVTAPLPPKPDDKPDEM